MAPWTRLIRFVAVETGKVHLGQPVDANVDVGLAFLSKSPVKVFEILGSALDANAEVSKKVLTVKTLLTPLAREQVKLVRCLGLNYSDHADEGGFQKPVVPNLFYKPVTGLIGPNAPIVIPKVAQPVEFHLPDYEVELTIVIGKPCKDVSEADALDYVLGYAVGNDISFRHHQLNVSQWGFSKGFDDTTPWGPVIVSSRVIPDPQKLRLQASVNGKLLQDGTTANQIFNVRQTIAHLSQATTLEPGSLIMTGTPKGVGYVRKPPVFLKHGDEVRVWIAGGLSTLVNQAVEEGKHKAKL